MPTFANLVTVFSLCLGLISVPATAVEFEPSQTIKDFMDKITFAHLPRFGMVCQSLLVTSAPLLPESETMQRELTTMAKDSFTTFLNRLSLPSTQRSAAIPNWNILGLESETATKEDIQTLRGRLTSVLSNFNQSAPDEIKFGLVVSGKDRVSAFHQARIEDTQSLVEKSRHAAYPGYELPIVVVTTAPIAALSFAVTAWYHGQAIPYDQILALSLAGLFLPPSYFLADHDYSQKRQTLESFLERDHRKYAWSYESFQARLNKELVHTLLTRPPEQSKEGKYVSGDQIIRLIAYNWMRDMGLWFDRQTEMATLSFLSKWLYDHLSKRTYYITVDSLTTYEPKAIKDHQWKTNVLFRISTKKPSTPPPISQPQDMEGEDSGLNGLVPQSSP